MKIILWPEVCFLFTWETMRSALTWSNAVQFDEPETCVWLAAIKYGKYTQFVQQCLPVGYRFITYMYNYTGCVPAPGPPVRTFYPTTLKLAILQTCSTQTCSATRRTAVRNGYTNTDVSTHQAQHSRFLEGVSSPEVAANGLHEVGVTLGRLRQVANQAREKAHQDRQSSSGSGRW